MKIQFVQIGDTNEAFIKTGFEHFEKRIKKYCNFEVVTIKNIKNAKNLSHAELKQKEEKLLLPFFEKSDFIYLLDEKGKDFTSLKFAKELEKRMNHASTISFVIGGAYGVTDLIKQKANSTIQLSSMTFSHQIIRLIFAEQLYRAFSILNNEPYHHE